MSTSNESIWFRCYYNYFKTFIVVFSTSAVFSIKIHISKYWKQLKYCAKLCCI